MKPILIAWKFLNLYTLREINIFFRLAICFFQLFIILKSSHKRRKSSHEHLNCEIVYECVLVQNFRTIHN